MILEAYRTMASDIRRAVDAMTPEQRAELYERIRGQIPRSAWGPLPGPQYAAMRSKADEVFYGGAAGGGKTDLLIGAALTGHRRSIIFRREYPQLRAVVDRLLEIYPKPEHFNRSRLELVTEDNRLIELGAVQHPGDEQKYQGRPHDLKGFDELPHFTRYQYKFLTGWNRSADPHQRKRVIAVGNPPTDSDGEWVVGYWASWLAEAHPRPAQPGELRWFTTVDGEETELDGPDPVLHKGEWLQPRSRTFIPARIEDNPYLARTDYKAVIQALPEPLRSKLLLGDFRGAQGDHGMQVIPLEWIRAAQARWRATGKPSDQPMTSIGVDVSRGGTDHTVLSPRYGAWYAPQTKLPPSMTVSGTAVAAKVLEATHRGAAINIDVIGVGASVYDALDAMSIENIHGLNGSEKSEARDRSGRLGFANKRAEWWWRMREALDPEHGDHLALPDDPELTADLAAPRWKLTARGIQVESKEDIIKRLRRSPDKGDAAVYALPDHAVEVAAIMNRSYTDSFRR